MSRDELCAALGSEFARTAVTESVAETGIGIRETFVFAVRIALDRIRALILRGDLPRGRPAVDTAEQLLSALEDEPAAVGAPGRDHPAALHSLVAPPGPPRLPDARVASGAIWPPVEGRIVLHEAHEVGLAVRRVGDGDWIAGTGSGWRVHSTASAEFSQFEHGRQALVAWAQGHAALAGLLSPSRCIVLAETGTGTWRLWQIVKVMPSLRGWLVDGATLAASDLFDRLATAAACLGEAHLRCIDTQLLPTLDTIGRGAGGPQFVSLLPGSLAIPLPHTSDIPGRVASALSRLLAVELAARRAELAGWHDHGPRVPTAWDDVVTAALTERRAPRLTDATAVRQK